MANCLSGLVTKADTVGVFVPSVDESSIESSLDRQYSVHISDLAASISHYPQTVLSLATSMSNFGLSVLHSLFITSTKVVMLLPHFGRFVMFTNTANAMTSHCLGTWLVWMGRHV